MVIAELPFFVLMILTILPLTIGFIIMMRIVTIVKRMMNDIKFKRGTSMLVIGEMIVYFVMASVIINVVYYLIDEQPSGFSIFNYLIEDMLPLSWYVILLFGILSSINIMYLRVRKRGAE